MDFTPSGTTKVTGMFNQSGLIVHGSRMRDLMFPVFTYLAVIFKLGDNCRQKMLRSAIWTAQCTDPENTYVTGRETSRDSMYSSLSQFAIADAAYSN
jgi:hypothetical protein